MTTDYTALTAQLRAFVEIEENYISVMANASALLMEAMESVNWAGFYLVRDGRLNRDMPEDTIDLIIYANNQIKRENSPIKNIVLDLSNNGGGQYRRSHICDRVVSGGSGYRSQGHLYRS